MSPTNRPTDARPTRSLLYIPASNARAMDKARRLPCDGLIFDLEDAVAPGEKPAARAALSGALAQGGFGGRLRLVRINALDTDWGADDARAAAGMDCDGILLPKVATPSDLDALAVLVPDRPLWAMVETPAAILNAAAIAGHPRLKGLVLGTNDLLKDLGARFRPDRLALMPALQTSILAARAAGVVVIDGVYNAFRDDDGLRAECDQGRDLGMDGKSLIHPAQIAIANAAFAPTDDEIDLARRQIDAYEAAMAAGQGVAVLDGRIVENLHVATARRVLALADAVAAREQEAAE